MRRLPGSPHEGTWRIGAKCIKAGHPASPSSPKGGYFYVRTRKLMIVMTHGFVKKTDRVPEGEIERAIRFMNDFQERPKGEKFES